LAFGPGWGNRPRIDFFRWQDCVQRSKQGDEERWYQYNWRDCRDRHIVRKRESAKEFKAAKVYAKNLDKNVVYMVFTEDGKYQAVDLFPGNYEVSVTKNGFSGERRKRSL